VSFTILPGMEAVEATVEVRLLAMADLEHLRKAIGKKGCL
jgi:hypothetical protein